MNWTKIGTELRQCATDAHGTANLPSVLFAYEFLLANPECFIDQDILNEYNAGRSPEDVLTMDDVEIGNVDWPSDMPKEPNIELIAAYYAAYQEQNV